MYSALEGGTGSSTVIRTRALGKLIRILRRRRLDMLKTQFRKFNSLLVVALIASGGYALAQGRDAGVMQGGVILLKCAVIVNRQDALYCR